MDDKQLKGKEKAARAKLEHGQKDPSEAELRKEFPDLNTKHFCPLCKHKGRKFNHPYEGCQYKPGGAFHGLKGEALKAARDKFFDDLFKNKRKENRRAYKIRRKKKKENRRASKVRVNKGNADEESDSEGGEQWWYNSSRDTREV